MNKIAAYQIALEEHPLWQKEAEDYETKRRQAAIVGAMPGLVPISTIGSAALAPEGRGGRAALGQIGGSLGGAILGAPLGTPGMIVGQSLGGGLGAYYAQGDKE